VGDRVLMLENAVYSVITPEGCAAILWKDAAQADRAAQALRLTASDLAQAGIVDQIVPEPKGGAHVDHDEAARLLALYLSENLPLPLKIAPQERKARRYKKLRTLGG
jgi:acetyl-CoA carboxylase carboxyl transferase subunit alpha